ncbi:hypothetical protein [Gemmatimonas sp.]|jgi:hypothetical protein|uniref:hypothetical protein n=1 Tax=Gemmatimonas sp. TaxID=1962908 RepID=UPI0037BF17D0
MYPNGLLLSLAVRASPQAHDGTLPSAPVIPNQLLAGAGRLHIQLALQGVAAPTLNSPNAAVRNTPVAEANDAPALQGGPASEPTVVTAIALTPQAEDYIDGEIEDRVSQSVAAICDETVEELIDDKIAEVREALSAQGCEVGSLEARVDDLEDREASLVREDTFEDLRLDVLTLTGRVDQLNVLRDTIAELTATCAALTARVGQLERTVGGTPRGGETAIGGEG